MNNAPLVVKACTCLADVLRAPPANWPSPSPASLRATALALGQVRPPGCSLCWPPPGPSTPCEPVCPGAGTPAWTQARTRMSRLTNPAVRPLISLSPLSASHFLAIRPPSPLSHSHLSHSHSSLLSNPSFPRARPLSPRPRKSPPACPWPPPPPPPRHLRRRRCRWYRCWPTYSHGTSTRPCPWPPFARYLN